MVEGMHGSLETILSLFFLPRLRASFEAHLEGNRLAHLQAIRTGVRINVGRLQCSDSQTQVPCPDWAKRHHASTMLVSVLERRASVGL